MFRRDSHDLTDRELRERSGIASFLKGYVDERMRDPETRALNTSAVFRQARAAIINTTTPEALGLVAASFLRAGERDMTDAFLTIKQLAERLRAPKERLETVIRRLRWYKQSNLIPYHQIVKGGVIRFRFSGVSEALRTHQANARQSNWARLNARG
jgi:hypothetical protein